jgi:hypothetical protein
LTDEEVDRLVVALEALDRGDPGGATVTTPVGTTSRRVRWARASRRQLDNTVDVRHDDAVDVVVAGRCRCGELAEC